MTPDDFVACLRREVLERNLAAYRTSVANAVDKGAGANHWPRMAELDRSLGEEQRSEFLVAIRQVMIDTLSHVLGILDGSSLLEHYRDYFHLTYGMIRQS